MIEEKGYDFVYNKLPTKDNHTCIFWNVNHNDSIYRYLKSVYTWIRYRTSELKIILSFKMNKKNYKAKSICVLLESEAVMPELYYKKQYLDFDKTYTCNPDLILDDSMVLCRIPFSNCSKKYKKTSYQEKKLLCIIAYNKSSNTVGELYSERLKAINHFSSRLMGDFDLYGFGWDSSFPAYKGSVANKIETLSGYKFSIVFENISNAKGWVTEKIFDCFKAGVIPVYYGAPDICQYIPNNCFIDFREFSSYYDLEEYLLSFSKKEYDAYLSSINEYLESDSYKEYLPNNFVELLANEI
tara:strand:- start:205 stop:1098 length:894 start_codon:yes stop_codon:yes gene_type:complete